MKTNQQSLAALLETQSRTPISKLGQNNSSQIWLTKFSCSELPTEATVSLSVFFFFSFFAMMQL